MEEIQPQSPDKSIREYLNTLFNRYNYVGVANPLKRDFTWQVALEQNEIVTMNSADTINEERMAQNTQGTFMPGDGAMRLQQKLVAVKIKSNEKRMIIGEAAYVVIPRIFNAYVREKYGTSKQALAKLNNPVVQRELLKDILVGPKIDNVGGAIETYVNESMDKIENFTDVQVKPRGRKKADAQGTQSEDSGTDTVS